jgi:hypothetical protein
MANVTGFRATTTFRHLASSDFCDHVSFEDHSNAVGEFYEDDSFGPVGRYIVCAACRDKALEAAGNEPEVCHDCRLTVLHKDTIAWKWYDFDSRQGDEPLVICNGCCVLPTHIARVDNDTRNYREEMGYEDDLEDEDDGDEDDHGRMDIEDELLGM